MEVERGKEINGERQKETGQGGGANTRKPQLLCVKGTRPWCNLEARHYSGSQMIGLAIRTG